MASVASCGSLNVWSVSTATPPPAGDVVEVSHLGAIPPLGQWPDCILDLFGERRIPFAGFVIVGRRALMPFMVRPQDLPLLFLLLLIAGARPIFKPHVRHGIFTLNSGECHIRFCCGPTAHRGKMSEKVLVTGVLGLSDRRLCVGFSAGVPQQRQRPRRQFDDRAQLIKEVGRVCDSAVDERSEILEREALSDPL